MPSNLYTKAATTFIDEAKKAIYLSMKSAENYISNNEFVEFEDGLFKKNVEVTDPFDLFPTDATFADFPTSGGFGKILDLLLGKALFKATGFSLVKTPEALERLLKIAIKPVFDFDIILQALKTAVGTGIASIFSAYLLPFMMIDTLMHEERHIEGTPVEDRALANLFWLIFVVSAITNVGIVPDEFAELFFEGLSDAISEIFEKLFKGALEVKTNILVGHEPMDDDEIKDIASTGLLSIDYLGYLGVLAGLFNSAAYAEVLTGLWYNREDTMNHIRDSALYHVVQWDERAGYMHEYKMDAARDILRDLVYDIRVTLRKYIQDFKTVVSREITALSVDYDTLQKAIDAGTVTDALIQSIKARHLQNLDVIKEKFEYLYDAKEILADLLKQTSYVYDSMLAEYARDKAIVIQQYVERLDASIRELWEQAKRLATVILSYRKMDFRKVRF